MLSMLDWIKLYDAQRYFELNQLPTRKEQIDSVMSKIDPMNDTLDQE